MHATRLQRFLCQTVAFYVPRPPSPAPPAMLADRPLRTLSYRPSSGGCTVLIGRSTEPVSKPRLSHRRTRTYAEDPAVSPMGELRVCPRKPSLRSSNSNDSVEGVIYLLRHSRAVSYLLPRLPSVIGRRT